jgi:hypothetical protein
MLHKAILLIVIVNNLKIIKMKKLSIIMSILLLTSCATTKQFQNFTHNKTLENNKARIYVIRTGFSGGAVSTSLFCDDVLIGKTGGNGFLCWDVEEGKHTIGNTQLIHNGSTLGAAKSEDLFIINAKPGKTYYIKQYPRIVGFSFEFLDNVQGERFLKGKSNPKQNYVE